MAEIKVRMPEGMLKAAYNSEGNLNLKGNLPLMGELRINQILEAALRWLSDLSEEEFEAFVKELRK